MTAQRAMATRTAPTDTKVDILLVDDDSTKRFAMKAILAPLGQNVVEAASGPDALRQLLKQDFAVILLDVRMPGMDVLSVDNGIDALATVSENPEIDIALVDVMMPEMDGYATMSKMRILPSFENRPIIALTAKAMKGDREKCIEAGASDYIAKPVDSAHLVGMLRSWLSH